MIPRRFRRPASGLRDPIIIARLAYTFDRLSGAQSRLRINVSLINRTFTYDDWSQSVALTFFERYDA